MEHVTFLIEDSGEQISCLLNPEKVVLKRQTGLVRRRSLGPESRGTTDDLVLRTGGGVTEIELDLLFDTRFLAGPQVEGTTLDIRSETGRLWALTERSGDHERAAKARMIWGKSWNIRVVVDALAERLEEFESTGEPKRSWLRVRLLRVPEDAPPRTSEETSGIGSISDAETGLQLEEGSDDGESPSQLVEDLSSQAALETGLVDWADALREHVAQAEREDSVEAESPSDEQSVGGQEQDGAATDGGTERASSPGPAAELAGEEVVQGELITGAGEEEMPSVEPSADEEDLLMVEPGADEEDLLMVEAESARPGWRRWAEEWVIRPATVALDLIEAASEVAFTLLEQGAELLIDELATWAERGEALLRLAGSRADASDAAPDAQGDLKRAPAPTAGPTRPATPRAAPVATRRARAFWQQREQLGLHLARYGAALRQLLADSIQDARLEELRLRRELQRLRRKGGLAHQLLEPYFAQSSTAGGESEFSPGSYAARLYAEVEEQTSESRDAVVKLEIARTLANLQQAVLAKQLQCARAEEGLQRDPIAVLLRQALATVQDELHALREAPERSRRSSSTLRVDLLVVWAIIVDLQRDTRVSIQAVLLAPTQAEQLNCLTRLADDLGAELQERMRRWMSEIRKRSEVDQSPGEPTRWDQLALAELGSVSAWRRLAIRRPAATSGARS